MGSGMMYPGGAGNMGYAPLPEEEYSSISPQVYYDQQVAAGGNPNTPPPPSERYDNATYGGTMQPTAMQTPGTAEYNAQLTYSDAGLLPPPPQYGVAPSQLGSYPAQTAPPPPMPSQQSQQAGAFLTWLQGGGMPTSGGGGYVSPVAARPAIGARPGDVVDTNSDGRIDAPMPLPNTTWGGMMESVPPGGYGMPFTAGQPSDPGYIQPSVTQGTNTTWGGMMASPYAGQVPPFDPNMVPGGARNTGGTERVGPSAADAETWDKSSGYLDVERNRAGFRYPEPTYPPPTMTPIIGKWDVGPGATDRVNQDAIDAINAQARQPQPPPPGPPPAPGSAPAPAAQGVPLITPAGEVYGTLTTNAQGQTVVRKLPPGAPNRWNIPQMPVTDARQAVPPPQVLPPGVTQTVAPGFALPPNFLPPAWADPAMAGQMPQAPQMPQFPRGNGQQSGGGRKKNRG